MPTFQQISFIIALSLFINPAFSTTYYQEDIDEEYEKILSKKFLKKMDANEDKKVSFDELLAYKNKKMQKRLNSSVDALFNRCDTNKDDKIDKTEAVKPEPYRAVRYYDYTPSTDSNNHAKPRKCDFNTDRLNAYDSNEDGFLDRKESEDAVNYRPNKKSKKQQQERAAKQQNTQLKNSFKVCDKNKDQQLSLREAASMDCNMVTEQFDAHDKNKDSYLSLEERLLDIQYSDYANKNTTIYTGQYSSYTSSNYAPYPKTTPLAILQTSFDTCDKNEDGRLAKSETISKDCTQEMWYFNQTDRDDDGFISNKELQTAILKSSFDDMDTDSNGLLEGKEFKGSRMRYL